MLPRLRIKYPSNSRGQMYIPSVNNFLWIACVGVILFFQTSARMEAAYGLAITVTMLMTTILLFEYLRLKEYSILLSVAVIMFFGFIEVMFFVSSITKFFHGGFVAAIIALSIYGVMYLWTRGNLAMKKAHHSIAIPDYIPEINALSNDTGLPLFYTNLVYLTSDNSLQGVDYRAMYSLLDKRPKRAKVYWFVNIEVTDEPFGSSYYVDTFGTKNIIKVKIYLGFRMHQRINVYLRTIVRDLMEAGVLEKQIQAYSMIKGREVGDFHFVLLSEELSSDTEISGFERWVISAKLAIKKFTVKPERWFGLRYSEVHTEYVPLALGVSERISLKRLYEPLEPSL